jgi:hypothetical protein
VFYAGIVILDGGQFDSSNSFTVMRVQGCNLASISDPFTVAVASIVHLRETELLEEGIVSIRKLL